MSSDGRQPAAASIDEDRLDFEAAEDELTSSWERALEEAAEIEPMQPGEFAVRFETSDRTHVVRLAGDGAGYAGRCTCPGYQFHDGPCAHLCAVFQRSLEEPTLVPEVDLG
ncbi:SWIM zinc finger family protein [Haloterrigena jeotgali icosahedral virus 1]|uniref:SWIM zinc finger domain-containing protein n=2 Tax=root TaxID=1 RepID=A0AAF0PJK2_9EURY|nr:SWIM zinc finger family protein [Natrinema thermotolerans]YP_010772646.1 SWIM zinc finger family protein [Haloterrigena jeotgali icosahedral virus 1]QCC57410.1 SWIM zinc finger family protein [Natrinema thermotolerans]WMT10385.1 SWIM zinc finger domain-containing protein [Natrinema thermotolerans]WPH65798.1 hypothetical protein HJIV1_gp7 [Haloterrigena jeotgali icosahedral virus 1]DAC85286.1 TPA_asm: SWIM zinc finger family protein [Haloterrigena jeotgali icosahedral virus 1]